MSASSLYRESTDSLIKDDISKFKEMYHIKKVCFGTEMVNLMYQSMSASQSAINIYWDQLQVLYFLV